MPILIIAIGVMALLVALCFSIAVAAGMFMAITGKRISVPFILHRGGIWFTIRLLWALVGLVVMAEAGWWAGGNRHSPANGILIPHFVSIVCFVTLYRFTKRKDGRYGMRVHLPYAIPCVVSFFALLTTGFMLYQRIPK
jgi:hypothetical protein